MTTATRPGEMLDAYVSRVREIKGCAILSMRLQDCHFYAHFSRLHRPGSLCQPCAMKREEPTVEDLEAFAEQLNGPIGAALRSAGAIIERRMRERGLAWADLDDHQVADLFMSAFMEAAPEAYPHADRTALEKAIAGMAVDIAMQLSANVEESPSVN